MSFSLGWLGGLQGSHLDTGADSIWSPRSRTTTPLLQVLLFHPSVLSLHFFTNNDTSPPHKITTAGSVEVAWIARRHVLDELLHPGLGGDQNLKPRPTYLRSPRKTHPTIPQASERGGQVKIQKAEKDHKFIDPGKYSTYIFQLASTSTKSLLPPSYPFPFLLSILVTIAIWYKNNI